MLFSGTLSDRFGRKPIILFVAGRRYFNSIVRNCIIMADAGGIPRFARHCGKWYYGVVTRVYSYPVKKSLLLWRGLLLDILFLAIR